MQHWQLLSAEEQDQLWNFVRSQLHFRPYNCNSSIDTSIKHRVIDFSRQAATFCTEDRDQHLKQGLLEAFVAVIPAGHEIYALEYEDDCYRFSPQAVMASEADSMWPISPCPISGFVFFISTDRRQIYCADGINRRVYLIGEEIVRAFTRYSL